jgi:hypothetical protein
MTFFTISVSLAGILVKNYAGVTHFIHHVLPQNYRLQGRRTFSS